MNMYMLRKASQNEEISRRWSEEHDTLRMPDIIFVMCSFKTVYSLQLYILLVFVHACVWACIRIFYLYMWLCLLQLHKMWCCKIYAWKWQSKWKHQEEEDNTYKSPRKLLWDMGRYKQLSVTTQHLIRTSRPMPISLLAVIYKSVWSTEGSCIFAQLYPTVLVKSIWRQKLALRKRWQESNLAWWFVVG